MTSLRTAYRQWLTAFEPSPLSLACQRLLENLEAATADTAAATAAASAAADAWRLQTRLQQQASLLQEPLAQLRFGWLWAKSLSSWAITIWHAGCWRAPSSTASAAGMPAPWPTFDLIINTTPLGMTLNVDRSPLPENLSLPSNVFIYDLVYNPKVTKLVRDARAQGLKATTGLGMLIDQAALSFEIWTGQKPPRNILYTSVVE